MTDSVSEVEEFVVKSKVLHLWYKPHSDGRRFERVELESAHVGSEGIEDSYEWPFDTTCRRPESLVKHANDRALNCMSTGIYNMLQSHFALESLHEPCAFGENMLLEGLLPNDLCIGDIFEFRREGKCICIVQVSSSRRACFKVNSKHGKKRKDLQGRNSVRHFCTQHACAGWFFRVLKPGEIRVGDELVLVQRKYPKFQLAQVASAMYADTDARYKVNEFGGSEEMLQGLISCSEFSMFQWKEVLIKFVQERRNPKAVASKHSRNRRSDLRKRRPKAKKKYWESFI